MIYGCNDTSVSDIGKGFVSNTSVNTIGSDFVEVSRGERIVTLVVFDYDTHQ